MNGKMHGFRLYSITDSGSDICFAFFQMRNANQECEQKASRRVKLPSGMRSRNAIPIPCYKSWVTGCSRHFAISTQQARTTTHSSSASRLGLFDLDHRPASMTSDIKFHPYRQFARSYDDEDHDIKFLPYWYLSRSDDDADTKNDTKNVFDLEFWNSDTCEWMEYDPYYQRYRENFVPQFILDTIYNYEGWHSLAWTFRDFLLRRIQPRCEINNHPRDMSFKCPSYDAMICVTMVAKEYRQVLPLKEKVAKDYALMIDRVGSRVLPEPPLVTGDVHELLSRALATTQAGCPLCENYLH